MSGQDQGGAIVPLSPSESKTLTYIWTFWHEWKNAPTVGEIAAHHEWSVTRVRYQLERLDRRGYIQWIWVGKRRLIVRPVKSLDRLGGMVYYTRRRR